MNGVVVTAAIAAAARAELVCFFDSSHAPRALDGVAAPPRVHRHAQRLAVTSPRHHAASRYFDSDLLVTVRPRERGDGEDYGDYEDYYEWMRGGGIAWLGPRLL